MDAAAAHAALLCRLVASEALPAEHIDLWGQLPPESLASPDLFLGTVTSLCSTIVLETPVGPELDGPLLSKLCTRLAALEAVIARGDSKTSAYCTTHVFTQLDAVTDALGALAASDLLLPELWSGRSNEGLVSLLRPQILQLPGLLLIRFIGTERFTFRELFNLARGDLAMAVATAVSMMAVPGVPPVPKLQVRLWQVLYHLSTPQCAAEVLQQCGETNDTPMSELLAQHTEHAHRLALCLVQFRALEVACSCAEDTQQRAAVLVACLRTIHNLTASPHLECAGRIIARQLAFLWPRFGLRLLAPHLRRLLSAADGHGTAALQAARELRRDLRTLGWVLYHSVELRPQAKPLCAELAMKAVRADQPPETLAAAIGVAANSGALDDRGHVYRMLDAVDAVRKAAVCESFPSETNRLWVIEETWSIVEDLGFWPREAELPATTEFQALGRQPEAGRAADLAAIARLQPFTGDESLGFTFGFNFLDPEASAPYAGWDEDDEEWCQWQDWDHWEKVESWEDGPPAADVKAEGPLGWLNVARPSPPSVSAAWPVHTRPPTTLLCQAPEDFRCAIDGRLCSRPVRTPEGILYEYSSILEWLQWNKVCPITGSPLAPQSLVEDASVSEALGVWLAAWARQP